MIPDIGQLTSRFLQSGAPLLLQSRSTVTSCTVSFFRTVSATLDTVIFSAHSQCVISPNERSLVSPYVMFNSSNRAFDKEREINAVEKRVDLDGRLRERRQGATDDA